MKFNILIVLFISLGFLSCKKTDSTSAVDIEETAQQIGDVMASVDEAGGSSGAIAYNDKVMERLVPSPLFDSLLDKAYATACTSGGTSTGFGSCTNNVVTRTLSCTIGTAATMSGTVTLTWNDLAVDNTCHMTTAGHYITRNPNFTITGRRGATLTVSKTGTNGQKIEYVSAGNFYLTNDGIKRVFSLGGSSLFDYTTTIANTSQGRVNITGTSRTSRILSGGQVVVTNNLTSEVCTYSPTAVTWPSDGSCTCPTSGSWSGSCLASGSSTPSTSTLTLTGCGTATYAKDSETQSLTFDRCSSTN